MTDELPEEFLAVSCENARRINEIDDTWFSLYIYIYLIAYFYYDLFVASLLIAARKTQIETFEM